MAHLAAEPGVRADNFAVYLKRSVEATRRLLEAVAERGRARLVFASSSSV